jgi:hypothetical protein
MNMLLFLCKQIIMPIISFKAYFYSLIVYLSIYGIRSIIILKKNVKD